MVWAGGRGLLENPATKIVLTLDLSYYRAKVAFKIIGDRRSRCLPPFSPPPTKIFYCISCRIKQFGII